MPYQAKDGLQAGKVDFKCQPHWRLLTGAYKTTSYEYCTSQTYASSPPSYHRQVIRFFGLFDTTTPLTFNAGQFVTIGIDPPGTHEGHSLYGFVYEAQTSLAREHVGRYYWEMEVEVHTIPGYPVDWRHARPFEVPPPGSVFIQPHAFGEVNFELLTAASPERWTMVSVDLGRNAGLFGINTRSYRTSRPITRLPPPTAYPRNGHHGTLVPVDMLLREAAKVEKPEPPTKRPPPDMVLQFDQDMKYLRNGPVGVTRRLKRKLDEVSGEGVITNKWEEWGPQPEPEHSPGSISQ
jgi:hypothetical protein